MAKHSKYYDESDLKDELEEEVVVAEVEKPSYNKSITKKLQLRISARVILPGPVTGKRYEWSKAGAIVEVDEKDMPGLMEKKLGDKACCGGNPDNLYLFVFIED